MPANKTMVCTHPDCDYTTRSPLAQLAGCRGHFETPAEPRSCPNGHGPLVELVAHPKNKKPLVHPTTGRRRRFGR
jgi:hypothetical protein